MNLVDYFNRELEGKSSLTERFNFVEKITDGFKESKLQNLQKDIIDYMQSEADDFMNFDSKQKTDISKDIKKYFEIYVSNLYSHSSFNLLEIFVDEKLLEVSKNSKLKIINSKRGERNFTTESFIFIGDNRQEGIITTMKSKLEDSGLIKKNTPIGLFRSLFGLSSNSGKITWESYSNILKYFIENLEGKIIKEHPNKWKITAEFFVDENGNPFSNKNLRTYKAPASSNADTKKIDDIVNECSVKLKSI